MTRLHKLPGLLAAACVFYCVGLQAIVGGDELPTPVTLNLSDILNGPGYQKTASQTGNTGKEQLEKDQAGKDEGQEKSEREVGPGVKQSDDDTAENGESTQNSTGSAANGLFDRPTSEVAAPPAPASSLLSRLDQVPVERQADLGGGTTGTANIVSAENATALGTTDTGDLLISSILNTGVFSRQVSPVMTDTRVRGYRFSEIRTTLDGAAWFPLRPDLDTPLSRFDSNIVKDVVVIRGPYNVRLGPGFSFVDVSLRDTPRHAGGFQADAASLFSWDTNGEQWYGRQSVSGGGVDRGWRVGYGHRGGSDYTAGDGLPLATGYKVRDWDFAYGLDLSDSSSLEFTYIRTDMTDVELAGQINDIRYLSSDGFSLRFESKDEIADRFAIKAWYNRSDFGGSVANKTADPGNPQNFVSPPTFNSQIFPDRLKRVVTFGNNSSTGARMLASWGDVEQALFTLGSDVTLARQSYLEQRQDNGVIDFGVPGARQEDAGIFADGSLTATDRLKLKIGGRLDFVHSDARPTADLDGRDLALQKVLPSCAQFGLTCIDVGVPQSFLLGAGYLSGDYKFSELLSVTAGVGYAERAPSMTELYADLPHLSIMQEGAFFVPHGNLLLDKEKALQFDAGMTMDYEFIRGGVSFFYADIRDFISYQAPHLDPPGLSPHKEHSIGTNTRARLAGGEFYGELTVSQSLTAFSTLSYVQGKDKDRNEPLWGIAPLDSRIGLRLEDPLCPKPRWGVEYTLRLVDGQDRVSTVGFAGEQATPGFTTHSINGHVAVTPNVQFTAGVENIGNALYREHLDTRLDLTQGAVGGRGIVRRGVSFYFALQANY